MEKLYPLLLVVLTSTGGYLLGTRVWSHSGRQLRAAVCRMLECVGLTGLCFGLNLVVGMGLILIFRSLSPWFVPLYLVNDVSLLALSLLQGVTLYWWWWCSPA